MHAPRTLLEMAGADLAPVSLREAALVLIDCQNEYVDGRLVLDGVEPAVAEAARVLDRARAAGAPVVHIVQRGAAGGAFDLAGHGGKIAAALTPRTGEEVIEKSLPNAFAGTSLHERLQHLEKKRLVLVGFMTHMCVSSTARAALDLGYRSTIVAGATATRPLPLPGGGVIEAATLQGAALAELADRFATVVPDAGALPA
jgi:nicotinamidase-related amidase